MIARWYQVAGCRERHRHGARCRPRRLAGSRAAGRSVRRCTRPRPGRGQEALVPLAWLRSHSPGFSLPRCVLRLSQSSLCERRAAKHTDPRPPPPACPVPAPDPHRPRPATSHPRPGQRWAGRAPSARGRSDLAVLRVVSRPDGHHRRWTPAGRRSGAVPCGPLIAGGVRMAQQYRAIVIGCGAVGAAATYWLSRLLGRRRTGARAVPARALPRGIGGSFPGDPARLQPARVHGADPAPTRAGTSPSGVPGCSSCTARAG